MVRWCWVNFQCRGVLLIWLIVGQGPAALAVGAGGGCLEIFTLIYLFSPLSPSLGDGPIWTELSSQMTVLPKTTNQPTNQRPKTSFRLDVHMSIFCPIFQPNIKYTGK